MTSGLIKMQLQFESLAPCKSPVAGSGYEIKFHKGWDRPSPNPSLTKGGELRSRRGLWPAEGADLIETGFSTPYGEASSPAVRRN